MKIGPIIICIFLGTNLAHAAGFYDFNVSRNETPRGSKDISVALVGVNSEELSLLFTLDSTKRWEGFAGRSFAIGRTSLAPYIGLEGLERGDPKPRGLLITNTELGSLKILTWNEFSGNTGNFYRQHVRASIGQFDFGAVNHSVAGLGPRIDYRFSLRSGMYLQYLTQSGSSRLTIALVGTF